MHDYWNDPPEPIEPPYCADCEEFFEPTEDKGFKCPKCGKKLDPEPEVNYEELIKEEKEIQEIEKLQDKNIKCPHGNDPAECDACYRLSDFLYDCNRENRLR